MFSTITNRCNLGALALGAGVGSVTTIATKQCLNKYYGNEAKDNQRTINLISAIAGVSIGVLAGSVCTKLFSAAEISTAQSSSASTEGLAAISSKDQLLIDAYEEILDEIDDAFDNVVASAEAVIYYIQILKQEAQTTIKDSTYKLFVNAVKQHKENVAAFKQATLKLKDFYAENAQKLYLFDQGIVTLLEGVINKFESHVEFFDGFKKAVDNFRSGSKR